MKTTVKNDVHAGATSQQAGFTLVEILVAMGIFLFGALSIVQLQATTARGNADARRLSEATKIAREMIEEMELVRSFYRPTEGGCEAVPFKFGGTTIGNATLDPDAELAEGVGDQYCPNAAMDDDLWALDSEISDQDVSDADVMEHAERCVGGSTCVPIDANLQIGTPEAIYYVVWNLRAGYPALNTTSVRLYVFWRGFDGNRHFVKVNTQLTAKDITYYY